MTLRNAIIAHLLALAFVVGGVENTWGETLLFHASASGRQTMDEGEGGGNPFASALIEILQKKEVRLGDSYGQKKLRLSNPGCARNRLCPALGARAFPLGREAHRPCACRFKLRTRGRHIIAGRRPRRPSNDFRADQGGIQDRAGIGSRPQGHEKKAR
jgi:hypothetical protein